MQLIFFLLIGRCSESYVWFWKQMCTNDRERELGNKTKREEEEKNIQKIKYFYDIFLVSCAYSSACQHFFTYTCFRLSSFFSSSFSLHTYSTTYITTILRHKVYCYVWSFFIDLFIYCKTNQVHTLQPSIYIILYCRVRSFLLTLLRVILVSFSSSSLFLQ